jgi:capsular polysaccharide biosynthesis protein
LKFIAQSTFARSFEYRSFTTINDAISNYVNKIEILSIEKLQLCFCAPTFASTNLSKNRLTDVLGHKLYSAKINEATVIGGSNLVLLSPAETLYDLHHSNFENRYRYTDAGILYYNQFGCIVKSDAISNTYQSAIHLVGNFSYNYYHLLYEILVKFQMINETEIGAEVPLIIDKICEEVPQFMELITILNKAERPIIFLKKGEKYVVNLLYYFSCPNFIPPNFRNDNNILPDDILFNIKSLTYLKDNLIHLASNNTFPKRIFISRSKASDRRKFNEGEVIDVFLRYGFEIVYPENYSITDQIAMFSQAEFIAGGSGAAFTNLLFCDKICNVLIFCKNRLPCSWFSTISSVVGANLLYFVDDNSSNNTLFNLHDSFRINIQKVNEFLNEWVP